MIKFNDLFADIKVHASDVIIIYTLVSLSPLIQIYIIYGSQSTLSKKE